ncbi:biliverdin-producing heme oxygenase, partial [Mycobacteroides abscessus]|nr:biliverdin-producing heme oxygenase [Mycobacteroides abscessus]
MNLSSSTVPASLSLAMRDGSRAEHDAAEQSPFISELLAGRVNTDGYVDYLMRLQ